MLILVQKHTNFTTNLSICTNPQWKKKKRLQRSIETLNLESSILTEIYTSPNFNLINL